MIHLLIILFVSQVQALTLSKYRSTPDGAASQLFNLDSKKPQFEKTSNVFDPNSNDLGIGIHELSSPGEEYKSLVKNLEGYAAKFKVVDDFLKTKGSSFNDVSGPPNHEAIIILNDYRIKPDSKYYAELDVVFKKIRSMNWRLVKGYRITDDLKKVLEINDGKTTKTSSYDKDLYCQKAQRPTLCTYYGGGQVYVK